MRGVTGLATVDACAGMLAHGDPIGCAVNPEVGRELRPLPQPSRPVRVVVVGAGPAGLEAACRAAYVLADPPDPTVRFSVIRFLNKQDLGT